MEGLEAQREMMDEESGMNFNSGSLSSHHSFKSSRESPMVIIFYFLFFVIYSLHRVKKTILMLNRWDRFHQEG